MEIYLNNVEIYLNLNSGLNGFNLFIRVLAYNSVVFNLSDRAKHFEPKWQ